MTMIMPNPTHITVILALHHEGPLAHRTLKSVLRSAQFARGRNVCVQILLVLDRPDAVTTSFLAERWSELETITTDFGDPGPARNAGILRARGEFIAIVDGDDLISENWLFSAWDVNRKDDSLILHPEINVLFDQTKTIFPHPIQGAKPFTNGAIAFENFWSALCFAPKKTFLQLPYVETHSRSGFGYEDWFFNCEAIALGKQHEVVPQTAHFVRVKRRGSNLLRSFSEGAVLRHSRLFDMPEFISGHAGVEDSKL